MVEILGENYEIILKKIIVGVPKNWISDWLLPIVSKKLIANLGPYIKKKYRDVSYFRGTDYHMDLIDHPGSVGDYVTIYVYLHDVSEHMSPLHLIPKSHIFGATKFPHIFKNDLHDTVEYGDSENNTEKFKKQILKGSCGSVYLLVFNDIAWRKSS